MKRPPHPSGPVRHADPASLLPGAGTPNSGTPERIPPQWQWHHRSLLHLRDRLLRSHSEHVHEIATAPEVRAVDAADGAQEKLDLDLLWAELGAEDGRLFEIDCALQRIRDGVYGYCEETGNPIPAERLRAVPWTRYCRNAAERHEKGVGPP